MPEQNENLQQGRYRIVSHLGQNGVGSLYEAYDNVTASNILLREIPVKLNKVTTPAQLETIKQAFAAEAKSLAQIKHGSFIQVQDHFSEIDRHYLVMDLVDGNYLGDALEQHGSAFSLREMTAWADQLLEALNYLHSQSPALIHRDIRPQNVKLTSDGSVKLLALGVSKHGESKNNAAIASQSFDPAMLNYLPLEQIWDKLDLASQKVIANSYSESSVDILMQPLDARSDIYALGATLYHLVTARRPVDALERSIDLLEGKPDPLPIPSKLNANIPPEVSYVLMKALDIKRENRFDSAIMMRQVLKTAMVRVKEREAKEGKQAEVPAPMVPAAEQKRPAPAASVDIHTSADAAADLNRQMEQIKMRLREAEAQKLKAEQRAAEAEKRLFEKESLEIAPDVVAYADSAEQVLEIPESTPALKLVPVNEEAAPLLDLSEKKPEAKPAKAVSPSKDFEFSYAQEDSRKGGMWKVFAAAAAFIVIAGGGAGIWFMNASKQAAVQQSISSPAMSLTDTAKLPSQAESTPQPTAEPPQTAPPTDTAAAPVSTTPAENVVEAPPQNKKSVSAAPVQIAAVQKEKDKKPAVPTAKAAPPQKKAVTVDDLISDH